MRVILLLFCLGFTSMLFAQDAWEQINDFPFETRGIETFVLQGKAYVIEQAFANTEHNLYEYDDINDSWSFVAIIPNSYKAPFVFNDKVYFFVRGEGIPEDYPIHMWEYDLINNIWTQKNDVVDEYETFGNFYAKSYVLNGAPYLLLPANNIVNENFLKYNDINDSWSVVAAFPEYYMLDIVSFSVGGDAYVVFGSPDLGPIQSSVWSYNPLLDMWTERVDFPEEVLQYTAAFAIGEFAYVGTGRQSEFSTDAFYRYDPSSDTWASIERCGYKTTSSFSFALNGIGYVGVGYALTMDDFVDHKQVWRLDPNFLNVDAFAKADITIYPNPTKDQLNITTPIAVDQVTVYNLAGQVVLQEKKDGIEAIQVSSLTPGLYLIEMRSDRAITTRKFIKN